jgi:hypothetical protein
MWAPLIPPLPFTEGSLSPRTQACITHALRRVGQMNSRHAMVRINDGASDAKETLTAASQKAAVEG